MSTKNVCSASWSGLIGESILLNNPHHVTVTVSEVSPATWPFATPASPFPVPPSPPDTPATLKSTPGNYQYNTSGCPGDLIEANPKTVIIS